MATNENAVMFAEEMVDELDITIRNQILKERYDHLNTSIQELAGNIRRTQARIAVTRESIRKGGGYSTPKKWNNSLCKRISELEQHRAVLVNILVEMQQTEREIC